MKLIDLPNWIIWKKEKVKDKWTKVPYSTSGYRASSTNQNSWDTFKNAEAACKKHNGDGIGFVFPLDETIVGIDLDKCLKENKIINKKFEELYKKADTYTEYSPSKTGLHLFLKVSDGIELEANRSKECPNFEVYSSGRYFTVTKKPYEKAKPIRTVAKDEMLSLLSIVGYPWKSKKENKPLPPPVVSNTLAEEEIIEKMFAARNGDKIRQLFNGDISSYQNDDSSADMALCQHLAFWTGRDYKKIERIWMNSPLGQRKKTHDREDYRRRTIEKAIEDTQEVYTEPEVDDISWKIKKQEKDDPIQSELWTLDRIKKEPIPKDRYIVNRLIPKGCVFLSGPPKSLKSYISLHLVHCLSTGKKFFNEFEVPKKRKVLIMDRENSIWAVKDRIKKSFDFDMDVDYLTIRSSFLTKEFGEKFLKFLKESDYEVLVLDSFRRFFVGNENDSEQISKFFSFLDLIKDMGITIICIHHFNKSLEARGSNRLRGSSDIIAYFDANINVIKKNDEGVMFLEIEQTDNRHDEEVQPFKASIIKDENGGMTFGFSEYINKEDQEMKDSEMRIFNYLKENDPKFITRKQLNKQFKNLSERTIRTSIYNLEKDKKIISDVINKSTGEKGYRYGTDLFN